MSVAAETFYRHGVTASGVDTITRESGVSKPTLYSHFRSKSELVTAALEWQHERRRDEVREFLDGLDERGTERILAVFDWLARAAAEADFRGCAFLNAAAELVQPTDQPARAMARKHKAWWRELFTELAAEADLRAPEEVGDELLLLVDGAYARLVVDGTAQPVQVARRLAQVLLQHSAGSTVPVDAAESPGGQR